MERRAAYDLTWQERAVCRGEDPNLFYPDASRPDYEAYKADLTSTYCVGCPVRMRCLEYALARNDKYGLWAGTDAADRRRIKAAGTNAVQAVRAMQRKEGVA